ncbi:MAG: nicotinate phosphoribosyltransferase [Akkermansiaceae bacterium]|jgi:nicotinate phosphoribosyltransferase
MNTQSPLLTDLYQLTMGYGYWKNDMANREAVFHLFYRRAPFGGEAAIVAGTAPAADFLHDLTFTERELYYLATLTGSDGKRLFCNGYLDHLRKLDWQLEVDALPEGELAFPNEPIIRVRGPLLQCQLVETALLNIVNFQTLIATKAARLCDAAGGDPVLEFGLRRAQGPDGGMSASRAAYLGGCVATSNVLAGMEYGIPVKGTHAHSWVMSFDTEPEAFDAYAAAMPNNAVLLVDTYDTLNGVRNAIQTGIKLRQKGHDLQGIRLDSGDLAALSIGARQLLDEAGFHNTQIIASNDLDDDKIRALKTAGARIDIWGVGTQLVTSADQPALGGVYKLGAIRDKNHDWKYRIKLSNDLIKVSNPGILQIASKGDTRTLFNEAETPRPEGTHALLVPAVKKGKRILPQEAIATTRDKALANWKDLKTNPRIIQLHPALEHTKRQLLTANGSHS